MDLTPTPEQRAVRAECRSWLETNLPWEYGQGLPPQFDDLGDEVDFLRAWQARLAEGRWVGVTWPEAYGGRGAGAVTHFIVQEDLARARAPDLVGRFGFNLVDR
jgi:alkylation response protein AidB-like acyl-CoA dehydrogenase